MVMAMQSKMQTQAHALMPRRMPSMRARGRIRRVAKGGAGDPNRWPEANGAKRASRRESYAIKNKRKRSQG